MLRRRLAERGWSGDVPAASNLFAKLPLQLLNLMPAQLPKFRMIAQLMPCLYGRNLSFEVDARCKVEQCLDGRSARRPGGVDLRSIRGVGHEGRRRHHHVGGWVGRRRILVRDMSHAAMFQRENEIDAHG